MMPTHSVDLTDHFEKLIAAGVASGRYSDASEAVQAGLALLEQQEKEDEAKLEELREIANEAFAALDRGEGISLNSDDDIHSFVKDAVAEARAERVAPHA
jgi:antitoxin ParD1/3/4